MAETSKTVDQALRLLAALRTDGAGSPTELARRLGTSRTVISRLVATLEVHDLVRRTVGGVDLGFGLLDLAAGLAPDLRSTARPHLETLAAELHETAVLAVVDGDQAIAVDQVVPDRRVVRIHYRSGSRHALYEAAHGRAILASSPPTTIERATSHHVDPGVLQAGLGRIRREGYAVTHDELEAGVSGIAAPVLDSDGVAIASVGVVAPTSRFPAVGDIAPSIVAAARAVTTDLAALSPDLRNLRPATG